VEAPTVRAQRSVQAEVLVATLLEAQVRVPAAAVPQPRS